MLHAYAAVERGARPLAARASESGRPGHLQAYASALSGRLRASRRFGIAAEDTMQTCGGASIHVSTRRAFAFFINTATVLFLLREDMDIYRMVVS